MVHVGENKFCQKSNLLVHNLERYPLKHVVMSSPQYNNKPQRHYGQLKGKVRRGKGEGSGGASPGNKKIVIRFVGYIDRGLDATTPAFATL